MSGMSDKYNFSTLYVCSLIMHCCYDFENTVCAGQTMISFCHVAVLLWHIHVDITTSSYCVLGWLCQGLLYIAMPAHLVLFLDVSIKIEP